MTKENNTASMTALRDMLNNAFSSVNGSAGGGSSTQQRNREDGVATNLTETNNCIARQPNLVDEIMVQKQQARRFDFFSLNPTNDNAIKQQATVTDEFLVGLTQRLNNLSVVEKQEAQNDIYGFGRKTNKEDPWELNMWMNEMDDIIRRGISGNEKQFSALRLAMHTNSNSGSDDFLGSNVSGAEYVRSQKLKFLRAANWVPKDAVERMAMNFEVKLEYFGSGALIRDLNTDDLTPTDLDLWKRYGFLQLSEDRDAYGRPIVIFFMKQQFHLPHETVIRCLLYVSTIITRDESLQRSGTVQLFWMHGQEFTNLRRARLVMQAYKAVPLRGVARHFCYDRKGVQDLFGNIAQLVDAWGTLRLRLHNGTAMECFYNLMTYGIPRNAVPVNNEGDIELDFHVGFLEAIEGKEADDEKRRRQERLDNQIRQMQLQNQMMYNTQINNSIQNNQVLSDGRGEPYQRKPPVIPLEESSTSEAERSALLSWNMSGLAGMNPFSLRTEDGESLPEDFLKSVGIFGNSVSSSANSRPDTMSFPSNTPQQNVLQSTMNLMPTPLPPSTPSEPKQQSEPKKDEFILVPGVYDVIMGRGRHNKKKPGNRKLNALLEAYQAEYEASDKFQKTVLSEVVVSKMIEDGSRFLVREGEKKHGIWVEVSLEKARDKVAHDFRNLRRSAKIAKKNDPVTEPSTSGAGPYIAVRASLGNAKRQRSVGNTVDGENGLKVRKASTSQVWRE